MRFYRAAPFGRHLSNGTRFSSELIAAAKLCPRTRPRRESTIRPTFWCRARALLRQPVCVASSAIFIFYSNAIHIRYIDDFMDRCP